MARRRRPPHIRSSSGMPVRAHFRADGAPKRRYGSEREARDVAQLQWVEHRVELDAYRCDFCSGWHLARSNES